jgi:hypothetical protein
MELIWDKHGVSAPRLRQNVFGGPQLPVWPE